MNPLMAYSTPDKVFVKLPSDLNFYDNTVTTNKDNLFGVKPRNARGDMLLANPDALMNGKAIQLLIEMCVSSITDASKLSISDVEVLLLAITLASGTETYTFKSSCPECKKEGEFTRDIDSLISTVDFLKEEYKVDLGNGVVLNLKPLEWSRYNEIQEISFKQQKMVQMAASEHMSLEDKRKIFNDIFLDIIELNTELMCSCIKEAITPQTVVQDYKDIKEYICTLDKETIKKISTEIEMINDTGINRNMFAACPHCNHEWEITGLKFDPSYFFG